MVERFCNQSRDSRSKKNLENQDTKKITSTWLNVLTSWACEVKQPDENKQMALDDWISQVVV